MPPTILSGFTQQYYHTISADLDLLPVSPTREAIFQYLSQIGFDEFPQFILDILCLSEGHTPVDITDGPGDEKQDILTIAPGGRRCLIQCKHKENMDAKYSGDELDRIVAACMRKNCTVAIFVTNGDLSPQAKNYITDHEYLRGWPDRDNPIMVDYWNGAKIYDKIMNNQSILNKWFSGMGQAHSLRNFRFILSLLRLPIEKTRIVDDVNNIIQQLVSSKKISSTENANEFEAKLSDGVIVKIKKWPQIAPELRLKLNTIEDFTDMWQYPLPSILFQVLIPENDNKFIPQSIKENIIRELFNGRILEKGEKEWWHIIAGQSKSFIYLHDINEPRQIELDSTKTYIESSNEILSEVAFCNLESVHFKVKPNPEDEEAIWIHNDTGIQIIQLFEEIMNPAEVFNYHQIQIGQLGLLETHEFRAVENVDASEVMRIRKILKHDWTAFTYNETALIWAFPPHTSEDEIKLVEQKLTVLGLKVKHIREEDKSKIIKDVSNEITVVKYSTATELKDAAFPINLPRRGFWVSQDIELKKDIDYDGAMALCKYKFTYENINGYDNLNGKETIISHTSELPNFLLDIFTIRCNRMIDIGINRNPISIIMRIFEDSLDSSNDIALRCVNIFQEQMGEIKNILKANNHL